MAVTFTSSSSNALADAYSALRKEELDLIKDFTAIQARLEYVRAAIASMKPLLSTSDDALVDVPNKRYFIKVPTRLVIDDVESKSFSKALKKVMDSQTQSLTTREVVTQMEESGWTFNSEIADNKINQVGVTFRRLENSQYKRDKEGKWYSVDSPVDLL